MDREAEKGQPIRREAQLECRENCERINANVNVTVTVTVNAIAVKSPQN